MELSWRWVSTIVCTCLGAGSLLTGNLLYAASRFTLSFNVITVIKWQCASSVVLIFYQKHCASWEHKLATDFWDFQCFSGTHFKVFSSTFKLTTALWNVILGILLKLSWKQAVSCMKLSFMKELLLLSLKKIFFIASRVTGFHRPADALSFSLFCYWSEGKLKTPTGFRLIPRCLILLFLAGWWN